MLSGSPPVGLELSGLQDALPSTAEGVQKDVPQRTKYLNHDLTLKDTPSPTGISFGGGGGVCVKIQPPLECLTRFPTSKGFGNRNMYLTLKRG